MKINTLIKYAISLILLAGPVYSISALAAESVVVDAYGSKYVSTETINKNSSLMSKLKSAGDIAMSPEGLGSNENQLKVGRLMHAAEREIKKMGNFLYVKLSPIFYSNTKTLYITVDLVDKDDKYRLDQFMKSPNQHFSDPDQLIKIWQQYEKSLFEMMLKGKFAKPNTSCTVWHCLGATDSLEFKKYENIFAHSVPKNESRLIQILKSDKDPQKRASAAFLLAYIKDGDKLIKIITPSMRDADSSVRNNAMRVLGAALGKLKTSDFPIQDAVAALDFPEVTDRNKALYILLSLSQQPRYAKYITAHAGPQLIAELKLSQLNVHNIAYTILKKISGQNYGERDYLAWEDWLNATNKKHTLS